MSNAADLALIQKAEIELAQLEAEYGKIVAEASLAGASMLPPPAGTAADIASLTISLSKGNWGDALLDAVGFIPIVGDAAKAIIKGPKIVAQKNKIQTAIDAARVKLAQKKLALKTDPKELQKKTAEACKKGGIEPCSNMGGAKNTKPLSPRAKHGENGRLESVFTKVEKQHIGTGTPTTEAAREHVRVLGKQTDDAGHAIGKNLGGKGGKTSGNIFPQSASVNRGAFSQFEKQVAKEVKAGKEVFTKVTPKYKLGATRPHEIVYQVRVNGKTTIRTFPNP